MLATHTHIYVGTQTHLVCVAAQSLLGEAEVSGVIFASVYLLPQLCLMSTRTLFELENQLRGLRIHSKTLANYM